MLGKRIRLARKSRGLGQAELGRLIGVQPLMMWKYEDGRSTPPLERLRRIARALGVTIDYLVQGKPRKKREPKAISAALDAPSEASST